jgi:UDP-N-acetylmuramyl pentapeptide phosphotransferase/UDP-N-acetylglucosamine-1-phosphate transferase
MLPGFSQYLIVFLTGLGVTLLLTPLVKKWATLLGAVDQPNARRPHRRPTPRGGGFAVIIGVHAACLVALAFPWGQLAGGLNLKWWGHFTLASLVLLVTGVIDDVRGLRPLVKLTGQTLAAVIVTFSGVRFGKLFGLELAPALDCVLVVIWILAAINAFNLIDGLDGLASGLALISAAGLCGIFIMEKLPGNVVVLLGFMGACLGFLRYNFHPASIFLGDTGSMFLGFTLGMISLQTYTKSTFLLAFSIPVLVLGVPLYDEVLAVWRRSVRRFLAQDQPGHPRKSGIMQPDLDHLHHRLVKAGLSTRRVAGFLYAINAVLVGFGLLITVFKSHASGIFLMALLAAVYVLMRHLAVLELRDTGRAILSGLRRPTHATYIALGYPVWDMLWMTSSLAFAMRAFEPPPPDFWHSWFLDLPVWVTPTFSLMAASRNYVTVWARARGLDVLMLLSVLWVGLALSLGIALLMDPSHPQTALLRALAVGAISHPAILGARALYRFTEEFVIYLRNKSEIKPETGRLLLYGAGGRCQLFLKERGFDNSGSFDSQAIVGLLDDDPFLHAQWVYGYPVLGGLKQLPQILTSRRITGIIITTHLKSESLAAVKSLAKARGIELSEWGFGRHQVNLEHALPLSHFAELWPPTEKNKSESKTHPTDPLPKPVTP